MQQTDTTLNPSSSTDLEERLTLCDREPIHIPGAIQSHGMLLIADASSLKIVGVAGDVEERLDRDWRGADLGDLIGKKQVLRLAEIVHGPSVVLEPIEGARETFDAVVHLSDSYLLVELEPSRSNDDLSAARVFSLVDDAGTRLESSHDLQDLCDVAAVLFREMTGYDRVMIYRFQEDGAGVVTAEARDPLLGSFLNHHFPATDIPRQARALYVRNRIRVIPDVEYEPQPIRGDDRGLERIDLSDVGLRSVSPIHVQYLRNMAVGASASISIVKDGQLWGLVACHHSHAKRIPIDIRHACRMIAHGLSRQLTAKDDAKISRERVRIRAAEDAALSTYDPEMNFDDFVEGVGEELRRTLSADGFAMVSEDRLTTFGRCPDEATTRRIVETVRHRADAAPFQTDRLADVFPQLADAADLASGVLAITLSTEVPTCLVWLRAEKTTVVEWAGNPHKGSSADPNAILTPRSSFSTWTDTVRNRSRPWSIVEVESAGRLSRLMRERRQTTRLRELNRKLTQSVQENELLLRQKGFLLREVNHRVQNSLQLVSAFLRMQAREIAESSAKAQLAEAQRRLNAVALVHRRLYSGESVEFVDLSRYLEELWGDLSASMDDDWAARAKLDLAPVQIAADRAVHVGLVLTELVINAQKYAYDGAAGPLSIGLNEQFGEFRLVVADRGKGKTRKGTGFGSRMIGAMVDQIGGTLTEEDNRPGLRTTLSASA